LHGNIRIANNSDMQYISVYYTTIPLKSSGSSGSESHAVGQDKQLTVTRVLTQTNRHGTFWDKI